MQTSLTAAERAALEKSLAGEKFLTALSIGFGLRGSEAYGEKAVLARIPQGPSEKEMSVCGLKGFLIDEVRFFPGPENEQRMIRCAAVAILDITDSPVHVHSVTTEIYIIWKGEGTMILDDQTFEVSTGNVILIPPGVRHGLTSKDPLVPVEVLLTFSPGLAPKTEPNYRDEKIIYASATERLRQLKNET